MVLGNLQLLTDKEISKLTEKQIKSRLDKLMNVLQDNSISQMVMESKYNELVRKAMDYSLEGLYDEEFPRLELDEAHKNHVDAMDTERNWIIEEQKLRSKLSSLLDTYCYC